MPILKKARSGDIYYRNKKQYGIPPGFKAESWLKIVGVLNEAKRFFTNVQVTEVEPGKYRIALYEGIYGVNEGHFTNSKNFGVGFRKAVDSWQKKVKEQAAQLKAKSKQVK